MTATIDTEHVVIDSSGWLEYITSDTKAELFAPYFVKATVVVPAIVLLEVRKVLLLRHAKHVADNFVSQALAFGIIAITDKIALDAAALAIQHKLSTADALIYSCAANRRATLVTSDSHFKGLPDVLLI
ncbi:MAG TPA: type II toxin-antitoxin system VapC family toxin [Candidatus Acidoferrum sp.]